MIANLRLLLTGSTGFIGRRLLLRLQQNKDLSITVLGRRGASPALRPTTADAIWTDGTGEDALAQVLQDRPFDLVIHLAGAGIRPGERDPGMLLAANTDFPAALIRTLARHSGNAAFILLGSCSEYAHSQPIDEGLDETQPVETYRLYGATKAAGTLAASATAASVGIPFACLRAFNVYGPGEAPHRLLPSLMNGLAANRKIALSAGTQIRDFVHVDDVIEGILATGEALLQDPALGGIYNLCTGKGTSVADFARKAAAIAGADASLLDFGAIPLRPDDMMWQVGNGTKMRDRLGWAPKLDVGAGLAKAVPEMQAIYR